MKQLLFILMLCCANFSFAQEAEEEFLPIVVEDKEAFMSTKTGEYVFRAHAETNPEELKTTASGVVYNDISTHKVVKGETLSSIAKKHKLNLAQLKKDNKLKSNKLSLGQELKIVNRVLVPSSSPVISYAGEERIIAKLRPGQSPSTLAPPPPDAAPVAVSAPEKTQSPDSKKPVSRKSTYYKPMVVPNKTSQPEKEVEVVEEIVEVEEDVKQESKEVIEAQRQLEEAQIKLALAKQKALNKEVTKEVEENKLQVQKEVEVEQKKEQLEKELEESVELKEKEEEVKAKYDAIQEKLEKVKSTSDTVKEIKETISEEKTEVKTPEKAVVEEKETPKPESKELVEGVDYHIIVKGDNLYNLARTYKTTVKKLNELNNVKFNNLKIGQKLKLK